MNRHQQCLALKTLMQDVRISFTECICTSDIIGQNLLCLISQKCLKCSITLRFHCIEVIGSGKHFHFTKIVILMMFIVMEFPTFCKHGRPCSPPVASRDDREVRVSLSKSDGSSNPVSNPNPPSILTHALLCLHLHWPLTRRMISGQC